jgi:hypothetical protein
MKQPHSRALNDPHARDEEHGMTRRNIDRAKKRSARDRELPKLHNSGEMPWNSLVNLNVVPATQAVPSPEIEDRQAALKPDGSGLALARQTVLDHGGEIWMAPAAALPSGFLYPEADIHRIIQDRGFA